MVKKLNPGYWEQRRKYLHDTPICEYCGRRNKAGNHKNCFPQTPAGKALAEQRQQEAIQRKQQEQDRQFWDHPDAADQKALIVEKYGDRPVSIKDWWQ